MTNLFEQADNSLPQIDESKDYLDELVGENKKFKDAKELAKGKFYADKMIEIQNARLDQMREDYLKMRDESASRAKLEELIDQLQQKQTSIPITPREEDDKPQFDPNKMDEIISQKIKAHEAVKKQTENLNQVKNKLREQFGSNYSNVLKERTEAQGLSEDFVNNLAQEHPDVLYRILGVNQPQSQDNLFSTPPRSQQRSDSFAPKPPQKRTWSYYDGLKKQDPNAWLNPKIAVQMQKDAIEYGDAFYDGNFYVAGLHER